LLEAGGLDARQCAMDSSHARTARVLRHLQPQASGTESPGDAPPRREKIAMIGSGNFGSALTRILGQNVLAQPGLFDPEVKMYVHEEDVDGRPLTELINEAHCNVKYLPTAQFTHNVVATPSLADACEGATMIAFCLPHQFLGGLLPVIEKAIAATGGNVKVRCRVRLPVHILL
jgi:hypothetical protein